MDISKEVALFLLHHCSCDAICIVCKEYDDETEDWVQVLQEDVEVLERPEYKSFQIW